MLLTTLRRGTGSGRPISVVNDDAPGVSKDKKALFYESRNTTVYTVCFQNKMSVY